MKKLFLFIVAAIVATTTSFAQSSMLATLSHEGEISTYYGPSALSEAYTASVDGDVITLSSGSFNAVNIEKGITIRGAGMAIDSTAQSEPTIIAGDFNISIPEETTKRFSLEGIYHNHKITVTSNFKAGTFLKNRFKEITYSKDVTITNLTMIHCRVASSLSINGSVSCVNSVIQNPIFTDNTNAEYVYCVVIKNEVTDYFYDALGFSQFKNCIIVNRAKYYSSNSAEYNYNRLSSNCVAYNCVGMGNIGAKNMFDYIPNSTNTVKSYTDVFATYTGTFNDNESFELTETAKTTYLSLDGTQVGIYGGNMPFSTTPSNPQITKCNVAAKSTADGKLSVDITVNGAE